MTVNRNSLELFLRLVCSTVLLSVVLNAGFVRVMENLESYGILEFNFSGLSRHGIQVWVMESHGKLCLLQKNKFFFRKKMVITSLCHGKLGEVMEKVIESHGISKSQKSTNPVNKCVFFCCVCRLNLVKWWEPWLHSPLVSQLLR